jgi:methionyl-tRNA formyltransferase
VIESGAKVSGATVHLVGERYDEGPIVAQWPVPVLRDDSPETLAARILRVEHVLLPIAIETLVRGGEPTPVAEPAAFELAAIDTPAPDAIRALAAVRREQRIADGGLGVG